MTGRPQRSAARWILVLRPPQERPSAAGLPRPAGSCHSAAPRNQLRGQRAPGPGRMLVRTDYGGIRAQSPALPKRAPKIYGTRPSPSICIGLGWFKRPECK